MRAITLVLLTTLAFSTPLIADEKKWSALEEATLAEANAGQMQKAKKLGKEALVVARKEFGNDDIRTASSLALLGEILMALEEWNDAEVKLRESSKIRERKLKPGHVDLEQSYNLMGRVLTARGRFDEAEKLHLKALAAADTAAKAGEVGPQAPRWTDLIASLNQLATFYSRRDDKAKALAMRKRAIDGLALYASKDKHDHLLRLEDLAQWAVNESDYADADIIGQAHLRVSESYFGAAGTTASLKTFAGIWALSAEHSRAETLYQRALAIQEKNLGAGHVDVATTLYDLAEIDRRQEKYGEAQKLYERSLAIREKQLGAKHPDVATTLHAMGELYSNQSEYAQAQAYYKRALVIREKSLEPNDPETATTLHNLGVTYFIDGDVKEAEPLYTRALAIREKALPPDHLDIGWSLDYLAWLYSSEKQFAKAESLYLRALPIMETTYGPEDSVVGRLLVNLATIYRATDRTAEAEKLEKRIEAIRAKE